MTIVNYLKYTILQINFNNEYIFNIVRLPLKTLYLSATNSSE